MGYIYSIYPILQGIGVYVACFWKWPLHQNEYGVHLLIACFTIYWCRVVLEYNFHNSLQTTSRIPLYRFLVCFGPVLVLWSPTSHCFLSSGITATVVVGRIGPDLGRGNRVTGTGTVASGRGIDAVGNVTEIGKGTERKDTGHAGKVWWVAETDFLLW